MSERAYLRQVSVRRMYGERFRLRIQDLSPHVNIIYGANASGKTTIAHAIQIILLPGDDRAKHAGLDADVQIGEDRLRIAVESGQRSCTKNGEPSQWISSAQLIRPESYHLSLHELLSAETKGQAFAAIILREASGGFDIREARMALGFEAVNPRSGKLTKDVVAAQGKVTELQSSQAALFRKKDSINNLELKLKGAREAERRAGVLEKALAYRRAISVWRRASEALEAYAEVIQRLEGRDLSGLETQLQEVANEITALNSKRDALQRTLREKRAAVESNILPWEGLPEGMLEQIRAGVEELKTVESRISAYVESLDGAKTNAASVWRAVTGAVAEDTAIAINYQDIGRLRTFAQQSVKASERRAALLELQRILSIDEARDLEGDRDRLQRGQTFLLRWLQAAHAAHALPNRAHYAMVASAILSLLAFTAAGLIASPVWFAGLAITVLIVLARVWAEPPRKLSADAAQFQVELRRLGVDEPSSWDKEGVAARMDRLLEERATLQTALHGRRRWAATEGEKEQLKVEEQRLSRERSSIQARIGLDLPGQDVSLLYLVERILRWQEANEQIVSLRSQSERAEGSRRAAMKRMNSLVLPYGAHEVTRSDEAAGALARLEKARAALVRDRDGLTAARHQLADIEERLEGSCARRKKIFVDLGLEEGDVAGLRRRVKESAEYRGKAVAEAQARTLKSREENALRDCGDIADDLWEAPASDVQQLQMRVRDIASRKDNIQREITELNLQIQQAEEGHALESAHAQYQEHLDALDRQREMDYQRAVGHTLADFLATQTRERDLPDVFFQAKENFLQVTHGRYELKIGDTGGFQAHDTERDITVQLHELSSATRVQLLLCVRVAFVEKQERELRLPLTLDETLGNSDDRRAEAIIETISQLAKHRQVFYFTAQSDEVAKWKAQTGGSEINVITLDDEPPPTATDPETLPAPLTTRSLKPPEGCSHEQYGKLIGVPPWSARDAMGSLHLWYLIEHVGVLYRLLSVNLSRWGPTEALLESGVPGLSPEQQDRLSVLVKALGAWREARLQGLGKPVERHALQSSPAISDRFIDQVASVCAQGEGDGQTLLEALESGAIKGFRGKKIAGLRAYLLQHGFITTEERLTPDAIRIEVFRRIAPDLQRTGLTHEHIDRLLERIRKRSSRTPTEPSPRTTP